MTDLFAPTHKGKTDTSYAAGRKMDPPAPKLRERAYDMIKAAGTLGLTADECADCLEKSVLSIRPRLSELSELKLIVDSNQRRINSYGNKMIVWVCSGRKP